MEPRPDEGKKVSLEELVGYQVETYLNPEDEKLIKMVFSGPQGAKIIKVLRKILMPTVLDLDLPIEEMGKDMFMQQIDFKQLQADEAKAVAMGLQLTTKAIIGGLIQLKQLAGVKEETPANRAARRAKDSAK